MADINILVDSSQVRSAKQELQDLGNSFNSASKSASIFMQAFERAAKQSQRDEQYIRQTSQALQRLINDNLKITNAYKSAEESAAAFTKGLREQEAQALKTARASQDAINKQLGVGGPSATSSGASFSAISSEIDRLSNRYDRLYSATNLYESELRDLEQAHRLGIISVGRFEREVESLQAEFQQFASAADNAALANNRFSQHANETSRGLNNFGFVAQQVGYQVGDFFVQLQSGTNVFVAFGQQATQLAGLIPGLAGAIAGIGISLVTAILAFNDRASAATQNTKDFDEALKSLMSSSQSLRVELEALKFGVTPEQAALILEAKNLEEERRQVLASITEQTKILRDEYGATEQEIRNALFAEYDRVQAIDEMLAKKNEEVKANEDLNNELKKSKDAVNNIYDTVVKIGQVDLSNPFKNAMPAIERFLGKVREIAGAYATYGLGVIPGTATPRGTFSEGGMDAAARGAMAEMPNPFGTLAGGAGGVRRYASGGGGGGGGAKGQEDALQKLREQVKLENELLGLSEAQERVIRALGDQRGKYSEAEINAITAEIEAYNLKLEAIKQQEQLAKTMQSSMEDAFMSIVSGTESAKDAFKKMAYQMIQELYRVLVVQRLVGQFQGGGGGILGALFGRLGRRASGGSVMPNQPYLVGEHGPELVIPRHSGTVVNANQTAGVMGNSGGVTVQNNITVTGSDAAMVRAEVAKMIPQITNATKAAVIDARLRGGQMKAAFS